MNVQTHLVTRDASAARESYVSREDGLHICALREDAREADFIASSDTIDRHGEVVDQDSWLLDEFKKNPVILYGHNTWDLPIGQATRVEVKNGKLECTIRFASKEANPEAEKVWLLVKEKVLRAVSVGFRPENGRYELRNSEEVFVYYNNRLREISVVAIPANPDALAKLEAMKSAARTAPAPTNNTDPNAAKAATPSNGEKDDAMNLQEALAKIDSMNVTLGEANLAAKTAADRATAAETRATAAEASVKTLETEKTALTTELEKASKARDEATKRADEAEATIIANEVDALIGKKIEPSEKDDFIALRKSSPEVFKKTVALRKEMKLTERVTTPDPKDKNAETSTDLGDPGGELARSL